MKIFNVNNFKFINFMGRLKLSNLVAGFVIFPLFLSVTFASENAFSKEIQYICKYGYKVKIRNHLSDKPNPKVFYDEEKYTFFYDGKNGYYINLEFGEKIPLHAIKEGNKITFIENAASDNLFLVTIFEGKSNSSMLRSIKSLYSFGDLPEFYDPEQSYGNCYVVR